MWSSGKLGRSKGRKIKPTDGIADIHRIWFNLNGNRFPLPIIIVVEAVTDNFLQGMNRVVEGPLSLRSIIYFLNILLDDVCLEVGHRLVVDTVNRTFDGRDFNEVVRILKYTLGVHHRLQYLQGFGIYRSPWYLSEKIDHG